MNFGVEQQPVLGKILALLPDLVVAMPVWVVGILLNLEMRKDYTFGYIITSPKRHGYEKSKQFFAFCISYC